MRVAVAGGTGLVGRHVVRGLTAAGHEPVVVSRSVGVDLRTGEGLDNALTGVEVVVDVSNVTTVRAKVSVEFFTAVSRNLVEAGERAGVSHLVGLSIVGIDEVDFGYYEGKRRQEELILNATVPVTVMRATQFHEFAGQTLAGGKFGPISIVPRMTCQPVAAREVADALVSLASGTAVGRTPDLAGPRQEDVVSMARRLLRAAGKHRVVVPVRIPGAAGKTMARSGLLPKGPGSRSVQTFDEWLVGDDVKEWL